MLRSMIVATMILLTAGCHTTIFEPDYVAPNAPRGLRTLTGDNMIELFWDHNPERDLAGYNVWVSDRYDGRYEIIGTTGEAYFCDRGVRNGSVYYYAVTAFDFDGNESDLSRDVAYDIPRPEGYDVVLNDAWISPDYSGYDFSAYSIVAFDDQKCDMYFENYNGDLYMVVREDTDIRDMGPTSSLLEISTAPADGWAPTHDVRVKVGHTYVVWTWDDHYAKFRVTALSPGRIVFDWAYQVRPSTPLLKRPGGERSAEPGRLRAR